MGFRENLTLDSNSPPLITSEKHVFKKLDFYWFPVDQSKKRTNNQTNKQTVNFGIKTLTTVKEIWNKNKAKDLCVKSFFFFLFTWRLIK